MHRPLPYQFPHANTIRISMYIHANNSTKTKRNKPKQGRFRGEVGENIKKRPPGGAGPIGGGVGGSARQLGINHA